MRRMLLKNWKVSGRPGVNAVGGGGWLRDGILTLTKGQYPVEHGDLWEPRASTMNIGDVVNLFCNSEDALCYFRAKFDGDAEAPQPLGA